MVLFYIVMAVFLAVSFWSIAEDITNDIENDREEEE